MHYCKKKERRSLINLFKVFDCDNCKYLLEDEIIKIGYQIIQVYYLKQMCIFDNKDIFYKDSERIRIIFKEIIFSVIKKEKNIFLWLEVDDDLSRYYDEMEYFLNNGYNIIIII